jgi:hypothetical protein
MSSLFQAFRAFSWTPSGGFVIHCFVEIDFNDSEMLQLTQVV